MFLNELFRAEVAVAAGVVLASVVVIYVCKLAWSFLRPFFLAALFIGGLHVYWMYYALPMIIKNPEQVNLQETEPINVILKRWLMHLAQMLA